MNTVALKLVEFKVLENIKKNVDVFTIFHQSFNQEWAAESNFCKM